MNIFSIVITLTQYISTLAQIHYDYEEVRHVSLLGLGGAYQIWAFFEVRKKLKKTQKLFIKV